MNKLKKEGLESADLLFICKLIYSEAAIVLDEAKSYLIEARLEPLARREGFETCQDFIAELRKVNGKPSPLVAKAVDAMTTNETSFFRDLHPFMALRKYLLPEIIERRRATRSLNIWCAAASSGQEPYTITLLLKEYFPELLGWDINFLATDISDEMLARCQEGRFSKLEVNRGLPAPMLVKHFEQDKTEWIIKKELRDLIEFKKLNLIERWPSMPKMDLVFIRNVLIYFDPDTKREILAQISQNLDPEGFLFLGGAETTLNLSTDFHRYRIEKSTCYTLREREPIDPKSPSAK